MNVEQPHEAWPIIEREPEHEADVPPDLSGGDPHRCSRCGYHMFVWCITQTDGTPIGSCEPEGGEG